MWEYARDVGVTRSGIGRVLGVRSRGIAGDEEDRDNFVVVGEAMVARD